MCDKSWSEAGVYSQNDAMSSTLSCVNCDIGMNKALVLTPDNDMKLSTCGKYRLQFEDKINVVRREGHCAIPLTNIDHLSLLKPVYPRATSADMCENGNCVGPIEQWIGQSDLDEHKQLNAAEAKECVNCTVNGISDKSRTHDQCEINFDDVPGVLKLIFN